MTLADHRDPRALPRPHPLPRTRVDDWRALHGIPGYPQADGLRPHRLTDAPDTSVRATARATLGALTGDKEARPVRSTPEHGLGQHPPY